MADDFRHEIYLTAVENGGVKVVSSCSHMGAVNIVRDAKRRFGLPVLAFVGGLHLRGERSGSLNCSRREAEEMICALYGEMEGRIYTCHCTGKKGLALLRNAFGKRVTRFSTGDSFLV